MDRTEKDMNSIIAADMDSGKQYEDIVIHCGELLDHARLLESHKNKEAANYAGELYGITRLEMTRIDTIHGMVLRVMDFVDEEDAQVIDLKRARRFIFDEDDGIMTNYAVYPRVGEPEWDELTLKRIRVFLMQLHQANERQSLVGDSNYYRYHDSMTKHTNMAFFSDKCEEYINSGTIGNYTALSVNISDFTNLNLQIGSTNCDVILVRYLDHLKDGLEDDEVVSRNSGDEFALLIHNDHEQMILEKLKNSEIRYGEGDFDTVEVSAEAGIYHLNEHVESHHYIIQAISSALNMAKSSVQMQFAYYDQIAKEQQEQRKYYESRFEDALKNEEIHVYFQPKVSLKDYDLIGAEALSRWIVDGQIVPPDMFIPILEETSRICELDFYVLEHVCKSISSWLDHGVQPVKVSVNFSRRHLSNVNLVKDIVAMLDNYAVPHEYLEVELTETTIDADYAALKEIVYDLREHGIESSVDDFGMGYSSLSLIRDVPFKVLKIDKSFLGDKNTQTARQRAMMKHVISMANDLGMECIAEGVESMEHVQLLKENKCYMAQGFLFNKPIPREEFEEILGHSGSLDEYEG